MRVDKINRITSPAQNIVKKVAEATHSGSLCAQRVSNQHKLNKFDTIALKCYSVGKNIFKAVPGGTLAKTGVVLGFFSPVPCGFLAGYAIGSGLDFVRNKIKSNQNLHNA